MKIVFPEQTRCPGSEYANGFLWLSLLRVEKQKAMFNILDQNGLTKRKIKNSMCGEVRSTKFFQNLKELIKTRLVMYFSTQMDEMPMKKTRITDLFNIQGSKSPSGGNQVDGLPPAPVGTTRKYFNIIVKVL